MDRLKIFLLIAFSFSALIGVGQSLDRDVVSSGGGVQNSSSLQLSFTVGETAVTTSKKSSLIISQGFQQAYVDSEDSTSSINEALTEFNLRLYPNPSQDIVYIQDKEERSFRVTVFDSRGRIIYTGKNSFESNEEYQISVSDWATGNYHFQFKEINSNKVIHYQLIKQ